MARACRGVPSEAPHALILKWILQQISSPDIVKMALQAMGSPEVGEAAARVLSFVPATSAGVLFDALAETMGWRPT